jgi:predicted SprT family Zn-dependent metalloprotease
MRRSEAGGGGGEAIASPLFLLEIVSYDTTTRGIAMKATLDPTQETYSDLNAAYDYFNGRLFGGELPRCLITMQRHKGAYGFFHGEAFARMESEGAIADEIALNPALFAGRAPWEILSTLVHEMCHLWQHHGGKPSRNGYHNSEWAAKMESIGLIPSSTGGPGGKRTGQKVSHYIDPSGRFNEAVNAYLDAAKVRLYGDRFVDEAKAKKKAASKTKYSCLSCGSNAWAKPETLLICGACMEPMEPETVEEEE